MSSNLNVRSLALLIIVGCGAVTVSVVEVSFLRELSFRDHTGVRMDRHDGLQDEDGQRVICAIAPSLLSYLSRRGMGISRE